MRFNLVAASLFPCILLAQSPTYAAPPFFKSLEWRNIGPNLGGRSIASAGSPTRPLEYYFGATGGGLWKTLDGGLTWRPVTDKQIKSSSVGAVAVAETNPDIVYIGMGETEFRGNIMQGDGVYKSIDAGKTWTHIGLEQTQAIARIRLNPANPDIAFVAALGHPFGANPERGIFRTSDGGKSWKKVLFRNDSTGGVDLSIDRANPNVVYAALWQVNRTPWGMTDGGEGSGLFKSTDGGDTWTELTHAPGLPSHGPVGKIGISVSAADPNRVYMIYEHADGGVFVSNDAGATWSRTNEERKLRQRAFYYSRIYADPTQKDRVYVQDVGWYRSDDGGKTFPTSLNPPHGDHHDLWISPNDNQRLIESNDGGASVSTNGGQSWTAEDMPTAQLYHVVTTTDIPYHVCGAQQDRSTVCVQSQGGGRGGGNGAAWAASYSVGGGESGYIAPTPGNPDIIFAGSQGALLTRVNRLTGQARDVQVYPRFFSGEPSSALPERWQWTYPIVFSPLNAHVLYTSSQHLWRTTNDGQSWERISPDLTRADPKTLGESGGPITHDMNGPEVYATIYTIAPSRKDSATIWTGSDDGLVFVTRDGGKHWTNVTPKDLPEFARISIIDASPHRPGAAYLAAKRYQLDDRAPYLYRTDDYGKSWTKIVAGIPGDDYTHAIREDLKRPGLLYAGTEHGVYVSFDNGARWQSLALNLPDVQVSDIEVQQNDLVIATHGRSMYVLDDIGVLRQLTPQIAAKTVQLFTPRPAVRGLSEAAIPFYLAKEADTVNVDILDAAGKVIRSYGARRRAAGERPPPAEELPGTPTDCDQGGGGGGGRGGRGGRGAGSLTDAGVNVVRWDLRHNGATSFPCLILWSGSTAGPEAVPGTYSARLTANGETQTVKFEVRADPRLKGVTAADMQERFALATKVRDKLSVANDAIIKIRKTRAQVSDRAKGDAELKALGDTVARGMTGVEEDVYQVRSRSGQDPLNFPIKTNNRIAALLRSIETGEGRPTAGAYKVYDELSIDLAREMKALEDITKGPLARFNALLAKKNMQKIIM